MSNSAEEPFQPVESFDRNGIVLLAILATTMFISGMNGTGIGPFLVDIGVDLNASVPAIGQAITIFLVMSGVAGVIVGPVADSVGHRPLLLLGIVLLSGSALATALSPNYPLFMTARLFAGVSMALLNGLALAIAGSYYTGSARRRAMSVTVASMSGAAIIGVPLMSWIAAALDWRASFISVAATAVLVFLFAHLFLPRFPIVDPRPVSLRSILSAYRPLLRQPGLPGIYAASYLRAIFWQGSMAYFGAFVIEQYGLSLQHVGITYFFGGVGFLSGSLLAGGWIGRGDQRQVFALVTVLGSFLFGALYLAPVDVVTTVGFLAVGGCFGAIGWVVLNTLLVTESDAGSGTTMSLNAALFNLGSASGGAVGGLLLAAGGYAMLGVGLPLFALLSSVLVWRSGAVKSSSPARTAGAPRR